jgi:hypothetical protein
MSLRKNDRISINECGLSKVRCNMYLRTQNIPHWVLETDTATFPEMVSSFLNRHTLFLIVRRPLPPGKTRYLGTNK